MSDCVLTGCNQVLQHPLIFNWSDHCETISVLEEVSNQPPNPILLLNSITASFDIPERVLQISLLIDVIAITVNKLEGKVSEHPQEGGEIGRYLIWVGHFHSFFNLNLL